MKIKCTNFRRKTQTSCKFFLQMLFLSRFFVCFDNFAINEKKMRLITKYNLQFIINLDYYLRVYRTQIDNFTSHFSLCLKRKEGREEKINKKSVYQILSRTMKRAYRKIITEKQFSFSLNKCFIVFALRRKVNINFTI